MTRGEVGGEIAYFRFLSDQWALGLSGGYHASRTRNDVTTTTETHSFTVRVGGDRYAFIGEDVAVYAGPGFALARGRWSEDVVEGPSTTELGFNGRIGMYARLSGRVGLYGHIGQVLSYTSGEDPIGKVSWWSSTHEGSVGLALDF